MKNLVGKTIVLVMAAVSLSYLNCTREIEIPPVPAPDQGSYAESSEIWTNYVSPSSTQIDSIGIIHNVTLSSWIQQFDYESMGLSSQLEEIFDTNWSSIATVFPEGAGQAMSVLSDPNNFIAENGTTNMIEFTNDINSSLSEYSIFRI